MVDQCPWLGRRIWVTRIYGRLVRITTERCRIERRDRIDWPETSHKLEEMRSVGAFARSPEAPASTCLGIFEIWRVPGQALSSSSRVLPLPGRPPLGATLPPI